MIDGLKNQVGFATGTHVTSLESSTVKSLLTSMPCVWGISYGQALAHAVKEQAMLRRQGNDTSHESKEPNDEREECLTCSA